MTPAINVSNLGKKYVISHQRERGYKNYKSLREEISGKVGDFFRNLKPETGNSKATQVSSFESQVSKEDFWALRDVSFSIQQGEAVGIIGRNGAGKSTLLKLLSRITEPSTGRIELNGRVASLLEVGTGFHPELTGRENIFLNGAILGMSRVEIKRKFDEIVAFAEVEKFLDTPVKRYSSGMYVRLAFAVAAHLEPEILIVDEVLAVGDVQFQQKCLGKMQSVAEKGGRTVLFVSHHMPSIQRLCSRAIMLEGGRIVKEGCVEDVIPKYLAGAAPNAAATDLLDSSVRRRGNGLAKFSRIELFRISGEPVCEIRFGEPLVVSLQIEVRTNLDQVTLGFSFISIDGVEVMGSVAHDGGVTNNLEKGIQIYKCIVNPMILCPGRYYIRAAIFRYPELYDHIDEMIEFTVVNVAHDITVAPANHLVGHAYIPYKWQHKEKV